ncbi:MAG: portal protein, partial [Gammaproteobacteria bacterium]
AWEENRARARDDLSFARLGRQWPADIERQRALEQRPCLTFNKMPAFIRQVVNDARQNKPSIRVHPQDSGADPRTARIINGLIRNIETSSDADVAYDTAIEHAVGQGFGFWRINTRYASNSGWEQDIVIERIANPFTVLGDPRSTAADSSDWNVAFIVSTLTRAEFEHEYPDAEKVDWDADFRDCPDWLDGDNVTVTEYWTREKVRREIVALADGSIVAVDDLDKSGALAGLAIGEPRAVESWKVVQRIISGAEVLRTVDWAGQYIPIIPVYGDEVIDEDGKRHFRSLIRDARSAQQMFNYWRTTTTELIALAPKAPFIGPKGTFDGDPNWLTANSQSHPYLEYENKGAAPQRQPFAGVPAGA